MLKLFFSNNVKVKCKAIILGLLHLIIVSCSDSLELRGSKYNFIARLVTPIEVLGHFLCYTCVVLDTNVD